MSAETLQAEQSQCTSEQAAHEASVRVNEEKIERLKNSKSSINDIKDSVKDLKKKVKNNAEQKDTWNGGRYDFFSGRIEDAMLVNIEIYHKNLDIYQDTICDEINRLENANRDHWGAIGWLVNRFNDLGNEIEKLFN